MILLNLIMGLLLVMSLHDIVTTSVRLKEIDKMNKEIALLVKEIRERKND